MMKNLQSVKLFATPKDYDEILQLIERMPKECRADATMVAMFTWNLACKLSNEKGKE